MSKNKLFVLIGKSGSGKDTILRELKHHGMTGVVSYTTRPPRHYEVDGVDYHFISEEQFNVMLNNGEFAEHVSYPEDQEAKRLGFQWHYGCVGSDLVDNSVIIVEKNGLNQLIENSDKFGFMVITVLVNTSHEVRRKRLYERGDNPTEIERRLASDDIMFEDINYLIRVNNDYDNLVDLKTVVERGLYPAMQHNLLI